MSSRASSDGAAEEIAEVAASTPPSEDEGSAMDLASSSGSDAGSDWGAADPAELEAALREIRPLTVLRAPPPPGGAAAHAETVFYLLGSAHISKQSAVDAERLVAAVRPETVMLELCHDRRALLSADFDAAVREVPLGEALADIASGRATAFTALYGWLLSRLGAGLECQPGAEFRAACRAAHECGAAVVLGDRPLPATLARVWAALSPWEKARLAGQLLWTGFAAAPEDLAAELEAMKVGAERGRERIDCSFIHYYLIRFIYYYFILFYMYLLCCPISNLELTAHPPPQPPHIHQETDAMTAAIRELGRDFPSLVRPLLEERDEFMVHVLRRLAGHSAAVVAVVGAGHLPGIREKWEMVIDAEALSAAPPPRRGVRWGRLALAATGAAAAALAVARLRRRGA
jgi:pheromone shutdown protein TraB